MSRLAPLISHQNGVGVAHIQNIYLQAAVHRLFRHARHPKDLVPGGQKRLVQRLAVGDEAAGRRHQHNQGQNQEKAILSRLVCDFRPAISGPLSRAYAPRPPRWERFPLPEAYRRLFHSFVPCVFLVFPAPPEPGSGGRNRSGPPVPRRAGPTAPERGFPDGSIAAWPAAPPFPWGYGAHRPAAGYRDPGRYRTYRWRWCPGWDKNPAPARDAAPPP